MLQEVMEEPGKIVIKEIPIPIPDRGEVLIKVMRMGICGSDIHVYHGTHPFTSYPITQGHEISGVIESLGSDVENLQIGQKVVIEPQYYCGECHPCRNGRYNLCESLKVMGFQTTGAASEYFSLPKDKVTLIPDIMTFEEGAMMEPLAVAVHAVKRYENIQGAKVAVIGSGPIGVLVAQAAKAFGAAEVMITDISDYRLSLAKQCGIDKTVNTKNIDFNQGLIDSFGIDKADVIYECAGTEITMNEAVQSARKGSVIILVAVFDKPAKIDLATLNDHELDLNTTMMYRHEDFVDAIRLVSQDKISLSPLMTKTFSMGDFAGAYEYIDTHREECMKVFIAVNN